MAVDGKQGGPFDEARIGRRATTSGGDVPNSSRRRPAHRPRATSYELRILRRRLPEPRHRRPRLHGRLPESLQHATQQSIRPPSRDPAPSPNNVQLSPPKRPPTVRGRPTHRFLRTPHPDHPPVAPPPAISGVRFLGGLGGPVLPAPQNVVETTAFPLVRCGFEREPEGVFVCSIELRDMEREHPAEPLMIRSRRQMPSNQLLRTMDPGKASSVPPAPASGSISRSASERGIRCPRQRGRGN